MVKTISIPEDLHKELVKLKLDYGDKNIAEMIKKLVYEHKKRKFLEFSNLFRQKLKEKPGLSIGGYMGLIMQKFKGKVSGKEAGEILKKLISK